MTRRRPYIWRTIHASGLMLNGGSPRCRVLQMKTWKLCVFDPEHLVINLWSGRHWYEVDVERNDGEHWDRHLRESKSWYTDDHAIELAWAWDFAHAWMTLLRLHPGWSLEAVGRPWRPARRTRQPAPDDSHDRQ